MPAISDHGPSIRRKLLLITASSPGIQDVRRARVLNFQQITMPYLAAFVPPHWEVIYLDEAVTRVDVTRNVDLAAITFHTPSAFHVYELAAQFRRRGIPVALGGPHVTLVPEEAQLHADVSPALVNKWEKYIRSLVLHETGHADNIVNKYLGIKTAIQSATCATESSVSITIDSQIGRGNNRLSEHVIQARFTSSIHA